MTADAISILFEFTVLLVRAEIEMNGRAIARELVVSPFDRSLGGGG
jgi:hypothetical protein